LPTCSTEGGGGAALVGASPISHTTSPPLDQPNGISPRSVVNLSESFAFSEGATAVGADGTAGGGAGSTPTSHPSAVQTRSVFTLARSAAAAVAHLPPLPQLLAAAAAGDDLEMQALLDHGADPRAPCIHRAIQTGRVRLSHPTYARCSSYPLLLLSLSLSPSLDPLPCRRMTAPQTTTAFLLLLAGTTPLVASLTFHTLFAVPVMTSLGTHRTYVAAGWGKPLAARSSRQICLGSCDRCFV
jgi:hypothetical protein